MPGPRGIQNVNPLKGPANRLVPGNLQPFLPQNLLPGITSTPILPGQGSLGMGVYNLSIALQNLGQSLSSVNPGVFNLFTTTYNLNQEAFALGLNQLSLESGSLDALQFCQGIYHGLKILEQSHPGIKVLTEQVTPQLLLSPQEIVLIYKIGELAQAQEVSPEVLNILVNLLDLTTQSQQGESKAALVLPEGFIEHLKPAQFENLVAGLEYIIQAYQAQTQVSGVPTQPIQIEVAGIQLKLTFNGNKVESVTVVNKADLPRLIKALVEIGKAFKVVADKVVLPDKSTLPPRVALPTILIGIGQLVRTSYGLAQVTKLPSLPLQEMVRVLATAYRCGNLVEKAEERLPKRVVRALKETLKDRPQETLELFDTPAQVEYFVEGYKSVIDEKPLRKPATKRHREAVPAGRQVHSRVSQQVVTPTPPIKIAQIETAIEAGKLSVKVSNAVEKGDAQALAMVFKAAEKHSSLPPKTAAAVVQKALVKAGAKAVPVILAAPSNTRETRPAAGPVAAKKRIKASRAASARTQTKTQIPIIGVNAVVEIAQQAEAAQVIPFVIESLLIKADFLQPAQTSSLMYEPEAQILLNSERALPHLLVFAEKSRPAWLETQYAQPHQISLSAMSAKRMAAIEELIFTLLTGGRFVATETHTSAMGVTAGLETTLKRLAKDNPLPTKGKAEAVAAHRSNILELARNLLALEDMIFEGNLERAREEFQRLLEIAAAANLKISFDHYTLGYIYAGVLFDKTFGRRIEIIRDGQNPRTAGNLSLILEILDAQIHTAIERNVKEAPSAEVAAEFFLYGIIMQKVKARKAKAEKIISVLQDDFEMWNTLLLAIEERSFAEVAAMIDSLILEARKLAGLIPDGKRIAREVRLPFSEDVLVEALESIRGTYSNISAAAA